MLKFNRDNSFLVITISLCFIASLGTYYNIELTYLMSVFIVWIPFLIIWFLLAILFVISVVRLIKSWKFLTWKKWLSPLSIIVIVLLNIFTPVTKIKQHLDFRINKVDRLEFIYNAENLGLNIQPDTINIIKLPESYKHTSKDNNSVAWLQEGNENYVLFYWWNGMFGEANGFLYCSNDQIPENDIFPYTKIQSYRKIEKEWYFIFCSRDN